jgi:hypothetical protein
MRLSAALYKYAFTVYKTLEYKEKKLDMTLKINTP